jgi:hypothetical protein
VRRWENGVVRVDRVDKMDGMDKILKGGGGWLSTPSTRSTEDFKLPCGASSPTADYRARRTR